MTAVERRGAEDKRRTRDLRTLLAVLGICGAIVIGCGGGDSKSSPTRTPTASPTPVAVPTQIAGAGLKSEILDAAVASDPAGEVSVTFTVTDDGGIPLTATTSSARERSAGARPLHARASRGVRGRRRSRQHLLPLRQRGQRDPVRRTTAAARSRSSTPRPARTATPSPPGCRRATTRRSPTPSPCRSTATSASRSTASTRCSTSFPPAATPTGARRHDDGAVQQLPRAAHRARQPPRGAALHALPHRGGGRREGREHRLPAHDPQDPRRHGSAPGRTTGRRARRTRSTAARETYTCSPRSRRTAASPASASRATSRSASPATPTGRRPSSIAPRPRHRPAPPATTT